MKNILLFGAGKSATVLIDYLLEAALDEDWFIHIVDADLQLAQAKIRDSKYGRALAFDINNESARNAQIREADIVISLLPAALHFLVAKDCIVFSKNLLTASYIDDNIKGLQSDIEAKQLLFICEMGLDPGIDHMSAMKIIDDIHDQGGEITSFKSHCGGLVAPDSDNNPWHYKISWNPRNIVLAGKAGAIYRDQGKTIEKTYSQIFKDNQIVSVDTLPPLAAYANRDSLSYINLYDLQDTATFVRTTLRYTSFCRGWDVICHLGLTDTDDEEAIKNCKTISEWFHQKVNGVELRNMDWLEYLNIYVTPEWQTELTEQIDFLDFLENIALPENAKSSADILQHLLENRLVLSPGDKDMIVMQHEIDYTFDDQRRQVISSLVVEGENELRTAMAKTVGLPLGIATKLILQQKILIKGLHIPIVKEIYIPVLGELAANGIVFKELQHGQSTL